MTRLAPVITCAECEGVGFVLRPCRCTDYGNRLLAEDAGLDREPYVDCVACRGAGTVADGCRLCRRTGKRRAQLVLTAANLDTGAIASKTVVAGTVQPRPSRHGGWELHLTPLVGELLAAVDARSCTDLTRPDRPPGDEVIVYLPRGWRPDLPADRRYAIEAAAIAAAPGDPWRVFLGRSRSAPPVNLNQKLARFCYLADLLCLDLVIEVRHRTEGGAAWDIRYELPSSDVPAGQHNPADDLISALTQTTVEKAMYGLAERGLAAPAAYLRLEPLEQPEPPVVDELERRILADCINIRTGGGTSGAHAIWRNRRWWHTSLRVGGGTDVLTEISTGQILSRRVAILLRNHKPPPPDWYGAPVPYRTCPNCSPYHRLRPCSCTLGGRPADPRCASCCGAGQAPSVLPCHTCRDSQRVYHGITITLTDLHSRVIHLAWHSDEERSAATPVGVQPGGKPIVALPGRYRLAEWAAVFGVRPEDLTMLDGGRTIGQDLRDGLVTLDHPTDDALATYLAEHSRGQPGARLLIAATVPDVPPLAQVVRLALGLDLAITITVRNHRLNDGDPRLVHGESWEVAIVSPGRPIVPANPPTRKTLESAIAYCLEYAELALAAAVPDDPAQSIHAPCCDQPVDLDEDPGGLIGRLGHHHPGQAVTVHYDHTGCQVHVHESDGSRHLATASTLTAAMASLCLPER